MRSSFDGRSGFTLLEVLISLVIVTLLIGSSFGIATRTFAFIGTNEADFALQAEANRAMERMTEVLRKTGWNEKGGVSYPLVLGGGTLLDFRVLRDLDGNGFPFDAATGDLEFGPDVYQIKRNHSDGTLAGYAGGIPVWHLARNVAAVAFATRTEDPTLQMKEIRVTLTMKKTPRDRHEVAFTSTATIDMRN